MSDLTVACVLRTEGGDYPGAKNTGEKGAYDLSYVRRLKAGVEANLSRDHGFVCFTDDRRSVSGLSTVYFEHDWPGWWAKLELFRPGLPFDRVLYLDLDTDIVGSLDEIASYEGRFAMPEDWLHPELGASGVMIWNDRQYATEQIYEAFLETGPENVMAQFRGDQNWISGCVDWEPLRSLYPGQIVSRWEECESEVPEEARIVCWHGSPRPMDVGWRQTGSRKRVRLG